MRFASFKKYALVALLIAVIGGGLHALPYFGSPASQRVMLSAARGLAAGRGLAGYGEATLLDQLAARLWRAGGLPALAWGEALSVFVGWTLAGFAVLMVVWLATRWVGKARTRGGIVLVAAAVVLATGVSPFRRWVLYRGETVHAPVLAAPIELAEAVRDRPARTLFTNATGLYQFLLFAPEAVGALTPQQAAALSHNPPAWRKALRTAGWNVVALAGPTSEYRPLLEHLITSPDWRLALVSNQGFLFLRGGGEPLGSFDPETFRLENDRDTAIYLAQIAERYDAIRRPADAMDCLERALDLAPEDVTTLSHAASFAAGRKHWQDVLTYTARALKKDPGFAHAKLIRALALLETGEAWQAQNLCGEILAGAPDDLYTLFLYARICRALHDYAQEAHTLERLVALSEKAGLPTVNYRIYLGQAYARQGLPEPALKNYRLVLESGTLGPEQEKEIRDAIATIEENAPKE
jgi:Putative Zn-dependent protease, contains TPR repeats